MFMRTITGTTVAAAAALLGSTAGEAAILSSGANAASVKVGAISTVSADAVVGQSGGSTPGAYAKTGSLATLDQTTNLASAAGVTAFDKISTGLVSTSATSNGTTVATGSVTLANPSLSIGTSTSVFGVSNVLTALGIGADAISSTSSVSGASGALVGTGTASIANLGLSGSLLGSLGLAGTVLSNPAANTVVFSLAGLTLTLNEQLRSGNGIDALLVQTNALHLAFNNYLLGTTTLNGDIVLGHSEAGISGFVAGAVPEPASWAMMIGGFGLVGTALRTGRRKTATAFA